MEIFVPIQGNEGRTELTDGDGVEIRFLLGDFFCQEAGRSLGTDVFQDGEYLGGLVYDPGMDSAVGEHVSDIGCLVEMIRKKD